MTTRTLILSLILVSLGAVHADGKDLRPRFEQVREIEGSFAMGERGRVVVPSDVFGKARDFPNDLRIVAHDGTQWPFFIHIPLETVEHGTIELEILNRSWVSGRDAYLQFDLVISRQGGTIPPHNQVELTTSDRDFVRRVEVFSEVDNGLMAVGHLIDFSSQRAARNRTVRYPVSDVARLHIRIYSNARNADEIFTLTSAKLRSRTAESVEREAVAATKLAVSERDMEPGAQSHLFDLGEENRPLNFVVFDVEMPSYARSVSVYGRNNLHEPWRWIGGGEIHALEDDVQAEIKLRHARHRYIKLHVFHHDDQPLNIQSIRLEAVPRYLVFEAGSAGAAGLYYRAWDLKPPRYDLKGRIETESIATLPVSSTADSAPNKVAEARPWRKYSKGIGLLVVGAVSLLVVGIIVSMLKQQKKIN